MKDSAPPSEGPVPEVVLYRLLSEAGQPVQEELDRVGAEAKLTGMRLGYYAPPDDSEEPGKSYSVGWGYLPQDEHIPGGEDEISEDEIEFDPDENPLSFEFIDRLATHLRGAMVEQTPPANLNGRTLYVYVYGTHNPCWGVFCCWTPGRRRRGRWVSIGGTCTPICTQRRCR